MKLWLEHGLVAVIVDGESPVDDDRNKSMPVEKARTREKYKSLSDFLRIRERRCPKTDDRMNFALRRRPPLSPGRVLTSRYPHPLRGPLLSPAKARQISSRSTPENTHVVSGSFPPLPNTLPEPPAYPCPHLTNFDALKPLYQRHWRVRASHNSARDVETVALEKKFTLTKYRHTLEFFDDVMGLQGICAQEKVSPSHITRDGGTDAAACLAPSNRRPVHIHDVDIHAKDFKCCACSVSARYPAFPRDNVEGRTLGYAY